MNASSAPKKKKTIEIEERRPRIVDVSLLNNEALRPWTIDIKSEERMKDEVEKLEKTITITTPQKWGGFPGSSCLEHKPQGFEKLPRFVHKRVVEKEMEEDETCFLTPSTTNPSSTRSDNRITSRQSSRLMRSGSRAVTGEKSNGGSGRNKLISNGLSAGSRGDSAGLQQVDVTDMYGVEIDELVDARDLEHLNQLRKGMQLEAIRARRQSHLSPMHAIKYRQPYELKTQSVQSVHGVNLKKHKPASIVKRHANNGPHASLYSTW